jgi:hypothetical protein
MRKQSRQKALSAMLDKPLDILGHTVRLRDIENPHLRRAIISRSHGFFDNGHKSPNYKEHTDGYVGGEEKFSENPSAFNLIRHLVKRKHQDHTDEKYDDHSDSKYNDPY